MKQIRNGLFETNSSSTHVITVQKDNIKKESIGTDTLIVRPRSFGWDHELIKSPEEKLLYVLILLVDSCPESSNKTMKKIKTWLEEAGITNISLPNRIKAGWDDGENYYCYIDHSDEASDFLSYVLENKNNFLRFVFGNKSSIETGNDNNETFPWWGDRQFRNFDEEFDYYKQYWVQDGEDENKVREEMRKQSKNKTYHQIPNDVLEFYKGN